MNNKQLLLHIIGKGGHLLNIPKNLTNAKSVQLIELHAFL